MALTDCQEFKEENRKRSAEAVKELGNAEYRAGNYRRAAELYTSAIMEYDQEPVTIPAPKFVSNRFM